MMTEKRAPRIVSALPSFDLFNLKTKYKKDPHGLDQEEIEALCSKFIFWKKVQKNPRGLEQEEIESLYET